MHQDEEVDKHMDCLITNEKQTMPSSENWKKHHIHKGTRTMLMSAAGTRKQDTSKLRNFWSEQRKTSKPSAGHAHADDLETS